MLLAGVWDLDIGGSAKGRKGQEGKGVLGKGGVWLERVRDLGTGRSGEEGMDGWRGYGDG